jgi:DNA-binding NarL/FixJ family response regulator
MEKLSKKQALEKYKALILCEKKAREEKNKVRGFLLASGVDLDGSKKRAKRNKRMLKLFQDGATNKEIAQLLNLSPERIRQYRNRFEHQQKI